MTIGVVSDTHIPSRARTIPDEVFRAFREVSMILHAGDLNQLSVLDPLRAMAELHAVSGNTDPWDVAQALPEAVELTVEGVTIGLTHGHVGPGRTTAEKARRRFPGALVVVYGHSHRPHIGLADGCLLVNPGSPTDPRGAPARTCAILTVSDGQASAELVAW